MPTESFIDHGSQELFPDFNKTVTPYPANKTIVDLFELQAGTTPDNIAIRYKADEVTYQQLNTTANIVAHYLIANGVKPGHNVGLLVTRDADIMIGMLGILKAGAAYVPIDPEYPRQRREYIINQSGIGVVLTNLPAEQLSLAGAALTLPIWHEDFDKYPEHNPDINIKSHQLAYTIYTSGSTGNPKGVMIEHHSVVNLALWVNKTYSVGANDRLMFITSICFDLSVYDIFGTLFSGGCIVVADQQELMDLSLLATLLQEYKITFWDSVPTTLDFLIRGLESRGPEYVQTDLRVVFLSGDWIPVNLPDRIKKYFPNAQVVSLGGATEATVWSNYFPVKEVDPTWKSIPYGVPIDNNFFYILDEYLRPVPPGEQGELYIGGVGVARGYANDKEKTDYAFVPDPFNNELGGRMYRTGDIGRMLPDGNMEFLGRIDQQVKIRGFRVELGEIESVLRQYKFVDQAVVTAPEVDGLRHLAGYIVPKPRYDRDAMLSFLRRKLPDYMVPGMWKELEALPLNPNGKIDRRALPDITQVQSGQEFIAPRNKAEQEMALLWQQVLALREISMTSNFFDLGGQSLLAVQLLAEVEKKYHKKANINALFKYPTVEAFAKFIGKDREQEVYQSLVAIKPTGNKMPLYIIHGDGFNMSNFRNLTTFMDEQQPVYSLQPLGMDGNGETFDNMEAIAHHYINEMTRHNPVGPYALAGYSFGGYVAVEMQRQLALMGKSVKMLGIFDTDAANLLYKKSLMEKLPQKVIRQIPKAAFIIGSLIKHPADTLSYQTTLVRKSVKKQLVKLGVEKEPELSGIDLNLSKINAKHITALNNYHMQPFNGTLHLFKAMTRIYFVDDFKYLGWKKFALGGVHVIDVPGDHKTMFLNPNVKELARLLQNALDHC